jgi:hypothetical protein
MKISFFKDWPRPGKYVAAIAAEMKSRQPSESHAGQRAARSESEGEGKMTPRRSSARPWTPTDDDRLRALAIAGASSKAIGMEPDRTQRGIRSRAVRLKIILTNPHNAHAKGLLAKGKRNQVRAPKGPKALIPGVSARRGGRSDHETHHDADRGA